MNGESLDVKQNDIETLRKLFPHIFSEDKIDLEKFQAAFTENIYFNNERYTLNWAGKSDAFKILQEGTTATLKPQPEHSVNFDTSENVFIEGENLEVLKILQKSYYNKVKCIIIDPPYNTGSDSFIYPDRFKENLEDYEKRVGERDEEGYLMKEGLFRKNSRENGHYHSNWLNMMLPRLFLARNLLRDDGVIFVHIDDNEVHNLRLLMNEIFGEENFVAQIIWERSYAPINLKKHFSESHDYILCYARQIDNLICYGLPRPESTNSKYGNPDNDPRGLWRTDNLSVGPVILEKVYEIITPSGRKVLPPKGRCWVYTKDRYEEMVADNRIWFGEDGNNVPAPKRFLNEVKQGLTPMTVWKHSEVGHNQDSMRELRELFEGEKIFDYSKPVKLIKQLISLYSQKDDFILDFFAGSATTAHAVLDLNKEDGGNRKFILVQLPELCDEESEAYKAGYKTIADISRERIRRAMKLYHPLPPPQEGNLRKNSPPMEGCQPTADGVVALRNTKNYMALPYNPKLKERAKELRKAGNLSEVLFWNKVKNKQFKNLDFDRQKIIGNYIADFYCSNCNVVIEIDGSSHDNKQEYDAARDEYLKSLGLEVIHITDIDIKENINAVMEMLYSHPALKPPLTPPQDGCQPTVGGVVTSPPLEGCRNSGGVVGFRSYKLSPSNFKIWRSEEITEENLEKQMEMFIDPVKPESVVENMLVELMLKSGYQLTDNVENRGDFYFISNELVIALTKMDLEIAAKIIALQPQKVITLDRLFAGNDELKTNTALQMRDAGVELRVV